MLSFNSPIVRIQESKSGCSSYMSFVVSVLFYPIDMSFWFNQDFILLRYPAQLLVFSRLRQIIRFGWKSHVSYLFSLAKIDSFLDTSKEKWRKTPWFTLKQLRFSPFHILCGLCGCAPEGNMTGKGSVEVAFWENKGAKGGAVTFFRVADGRCLSDFL